MKDITAALADGDIERVQAGLEANTASAITDELVRLRPADQAVVYRLLPEDRARRVFERLEPGRQATLLQALTPDEVTDVVERLDPDDRARLLDELPEAVAADLLARISPDEHERTKALLGYRAEAAGRIMTPEYVALRAWMTAGEAIDHVRRTVDHDAIDVLYVVDEDGHLLGAVTLRDLVLADPDTQVLALAGREVVSVRTDDDQELVARRLVDNDLLAVPVLDVEGRLVGAVTVDDAMDVLEREETEDVERIGGASPLAEPYLDSAVLRVFRARVGWLLVLFVAEAFTGTIMRAFESSLEAVVALAFFVPLLVGTGGNAGSQTTSTIVRAMAVGEVRFGDITRVVWKEARVGVLLGVAMAAVGVLRAYTLDVDADLAIVVALALISVVLLAVVAGSCLPIILNQFRVDPAVVSAPFITTLVDGLGLLIYFSLARLIMGV